MKAIRLPALPQFTWRKKKKTLRATATRRASVAASEFDDSSEPNMKLSRALLIVLLLHVVAVAGIIAFNAIKSRQGSAAAIVTRAAKPQPTASVRPNESKANRSLPAKLEKRASSTPLAEATKYYTVAKRDTPLTIARKFKVPYDELLAANHITDARKVKVGQKLIVPPKKPRNG